MQYVTVSAITGLTLIALSLVGSSGNPAIVTNPSKKTPPTEVESLHALGKTAFSAGHYRDARAAFWGAANAAMKVGRPRDAAMNWSNAGFADITAMQYRSALEDLTLARHTAEASGEMVPLIFALNNLSSLYLQMGSPDEALRISQDALAGPAGQADAGMRGKLFYQEAQSLAMLNRFAEAEPIFRRALTQIGDSGDLDATARGWTGLGAYYLQFGRYAEADWALSEALRVVRTHRLKAATSVLMYLAKLRGKQGNRVTAEHLFEEALNAHENVTPRWLVYYERGAFRLEAGDPRMALEDFRESRRLAMQMRADVVPADLARVGVEGRVSKIFEGLISAGNLLAMATPGTPNGRAILTETFDAAEQGRLWSLRSLVPDADDWRSRLPSRYWELLVRFQSARWSLLENPTPVIRKEEADLQFELEQIESVAGSDRGPDGSVFSNPFKDSPSIHVQEVLDAGSVLLSFSITDTGSWLWVVNRKEVRVYSLPPKDQLTREVSDFSRALQENTDSRPAGRQLYGSLFGAVPAALEYKRWFLEPDGPLYDLPFAALPVDNRFLIDVVTLQSIPGALLMKAGAIIADGLFIGIGDPVFNYADSRYHGEKSGTTVALPRLPNTASEVEECSKAWGSASPHLLLGPSATLESVESELSHSPAVVHFATHIITAPAESGSGLIALGLDRNGANGLLGPKDIVARRLPGSLVVMNGCHSARGKALPGSGLMGLTRAWIAAGANAVISTRWDVPDETAQSLMVNFYRALRAPHSTPAAALRAAQLIAIHAEGPENQTSRWAGYFLLSRI